MTNDYTLTFDYVLASGILNFEATGVNLWIDASGVHLNSEPMWSYVENYGTIIIDKYASNLVIWLNGDAIFNEVLPNPPIQEMVFHGFGEYQISSVEVTYTKQHITDSSYLRIDGSMRLEYSEDIDFIGVTHINAKTTLGIMKFSTYPETSYINIDGNMNHDITNWDLSSTSLRTLKFNLLTGSTEVVFFNGFHTSYEVDASSFYAEGLDQDQRLTKTGELVGSSWDTDEQGRIQGVSGLGQELTRATFNQPVLPINMIEAQFAFDLEQALQTTYDTSTDTWAKFRLILRSDGIYEDYIEFQFKYWNEVGSKYEERWESSGNHIIKTITKIFDYELFAFYERIIFGSTRTGAISTYERQAANFTVSGRDQLYYFDGLETVNGITGGMGDWLKTTLNPSVFNLDNSTANNWHTVTAYTTGGDYKIYLNNEYLHLGTDSKFWKTPAAPLNFPVDNGIISSEVGIAVNKGGLVNNFRIAEGTLIQPKYVTITGDYVVLVDGLHLLPDTTNTVTMRTTTAWAPTDITGISMVIDTPDIGHFAGSGDIYSHTELGLQDGIDLSTLGISIGDVDTYSNTIDATFHAFQNTVSPYVEDLPGVVNRKAANLITLEILMNGAYDVGLISPQVLFYDELSPRDVNNAFIMTDPIFSEVPQRVYASAVNTRLVIHELHINTLNILDDKSGTEDIKVVESAGNFPTYTILGTNTNSAKLNDAANELRQSFTTTGLNNGTLDFATDVALDPAYNGKLKIELWEDANNFFQLTLEDKQGALDDIISLYVRHNGFDSYFGTLASFVIGTYVNVEVNFDYRSNNFTINLKGTNLNYNGTFPATYLDWEPDMGLDLVIYTESIHDNGEEGAYVDNLIVPGYNIETFPIKQVLDTYYDHYTIRDFVVVNENDSGDRYVTLTVRSMSQYNELALIVNGQTVSGTILPYSEFDVYYAVTFYIPEVIDTSKLTMVSIQTTSIVRLANLGFMKSIIPEELFVAEGSTDVNDGAYFTVSDFETDSHTNGNTLTNSMGVDGRFCQIETWASYDVVNKEAGLYSANEDSIWHNTNPMEGELDESSIDYEIGYYDYPTTATCPTGSHQVFPDTSAERIESHTNRFDLSILNIEHSYDDFWIIVNVKVAREVVLGETSENSVFDLYLIIQVGDDGNTDFLGQSDYTNEFGFSGMSYKTWDSDLKAYIDDIVVKDHGLDTSTDKDYGFYKTEVQKGEFTSLDLVSLTQDFVLSMDTLYEETGQLALDELGADFDEPYWYQMAAQAGVEINLDRAYTLENKWSIGDWGRLGPNLSPYDGRFIGVSGIAMMSAGGASIREVALVKDPTSLKFQPAVGRGVSYFGGETGWTQEYTDRHGMIDLSTMMYTSDSDYQMAMVATYVEAVVPTNAFFTLKSNMPAMAYINDNLVGYTNMINQDETMEYQFYTYIATGQSRLLILTWNPALNSTDTTDGWEIGFSITTDTGVNLNIDSGSIPGITEVDGKDYLDTFAITERMFEAIDTTHDVIADENGNPVTTTQSTSTTFGYLILDEVARYHNSLPIPGDDHKLKRQDEAVTRIRKSSLQDDDSELPVNKVSQVVSKHLDLSSSEGMDVFLMATTSLYLPSASLTDRLELTFNVKDLRYIQSILVDNYMIFYKDESTIQDWVVRDMATGVQGPISDFATEGLSVTWLNSGENQEWGNIKITKPSYEGVHRISFALKTFHWSFDHAGAEGDYYKRTHGLTAEDIYLGELDFSLQVGVETGTRFADNTFAIVEPVQYDPMNYANINRSLPSMDSSNADGAARFAPLNKDVEGSEVVSGSWLIDSNGIPHHKSERVIGFKNAIGYCSAFDGENSRAGVLYTLITIDKGTPQMAMTMLQHYINVQGQLEYWFPSQSNAPIRPDGTMALDENYYLNQAIDLSFSNEGERLDDFVSLNNIGMTVHRDSNGYVISLPDNSEMTAFGKHGDVLPLNFTETLGTTQEDIQSVLSLDSSFSIDGIEVPTQPNSVALSNSVNDGIYMAGNYGSMAFNAEFPYIQFTLTDGSTGILYTDYSVLYIETPDNMLYHYNLISGTLAVTLQDSGMTRYYQKTGVLDQFSLSDISPEDKQALIIKGAFENKALAIYAAMSMANLDPNYKQMMDMGNALYDRAEKNREESALTGFNKIKKYGKAIPVVGTAMIATEFILDVAVPTLVDIFNGMTNIEYYRDPGLGVREVAQNMAERTCTFAMSIFSDVIDIVITAYRILKDVILAILSGPLQMLWNFIGDKFDDLMDFFSSITTEVEDDYMNREYTLNGDLVPKAAVKEVPDDIIVQGDLVRIYDTWMSDEGDGDTIRRVLDYMDMFNAAQRKIAFLAMWGSILGSAIGMKFTMDDLMGDTEHKDYKDDRLESFTDRPYIANQVLQIDRPFAYLGDGNSVTTMKMQLIESLAKGMGWSIGYDEAPRGQAPSDPTSNFYNYDILARRDPNFQTWNYFMGLGDLRVPVGLSMGNLGGDMIVDGLLNLILENSKSIAGVDSSQIQQAFASGNFNEQSNSASMSASSSVDTNVAVKTGLFLKDMFTLISTLNLGLVFVAGKEEFGLVGIENLELVDAAANDDKRKAREHKQDAFGRDTGENKFPIRFGITEEFFIYLMEMVAAILGGEIVGVAQDGRDFLFGDTVFDRIIGLGMFTWGIRGLGGNSPTANDAIKNGMRSSVDYADEVMSAGKVSHIPNGMGKIGDLLNNVVSEVNRGVPGTSKKSGIKAALYAPMAMFRTVFGFRSVDSVDKVVYSGTGINGKKVVVTTAVFKQSTEKGAAITATKQLDRLQKEFYDQWESEATRIAKEARSSLDISTKGTLSEIELDSFERAKKLDFMKNDLQWNEDLDSFKKISEEYEEALIDAAYTIGRKRGTAASSIAFSPVDDFDTIVQKELKILNILDQAHAEAEIVNEATFKLFGNRYGKAISLSGTFDAVPTIPVLLKSLLKMIFINPFKLILGLSQFIKSFFVGIAQILDGVHKAGDNGFMRGNSINDELWQATRKSSDNEIGGTVMERFQRGTKEIHDVTDLKIRASETRAHEMVSDLESGKIFGNIEACGIPLSGMSLDVSNCDPQDITITRDAILHLFGFERNFLKAKIEQLPKNVQGKFKEAREFVFRKDAYNNYQPVLFKDKSTMLKAFKQLSLLATLDAEPKLTTTQFKVASSMFKLSDLDTRTFDLHNVISWIPKVHSPHYVTQKDKMWIAGYSSVLQPNSDMYKELAPFFKDNKVESGQFKQFRERINGKWVMSDRGTKERFEFFVQMKRIEFLKEYHTQLKTDYLSLLDMNIPNDVTLYNNLVDEIDIIEATVDIDGIIDPTRFDAWRIAEVEHYLEMVDLNQKVIAAQIFDLDKSIGLQSAMSEARRLSKNTVSQIEHLHGYDVVAAYRLPVKDSSNNWVLEGELIFIPGETKSLRPDGKLRDAKNYYFNSRTYASSASDDLTKSKRYTQYIDLIRMKLGLNYEETVELAERMNNRVLTGIEAVRLEGNKFGSTRGPIEYTGFQFKQTGAYSTTVGSEWSSPIRMVWEDQITGTIVTHSINMDDMEYIMRYAGDGETLPSTMKDLNIPYIDSNGQSTTYCETVAEFKESLKNGPNPMGNNRLLPTGLYTYHGLNQHKYIWKMDESLMKKLLPPEFETFTLPSNIDTSTLGKPLFEPSVYPRTNTWSEKMTQKWSRVDKNGDTIEYTFAPRIQMIKPGSAVDNWRHADGMTRMEAALEEQSHLLSQMDKVSSDEAFIPLFATDWGNSPLQSLQNIMVPFDATDPNLYGPHVHKSMKSSTWSVPIQKQGPNDASTIMDYYVMEFPYPVTKKEASFKFVNEAYGRDVDNLYSFSSYSVDGAFDNTFTDTIIDISGTSIIPNRNKLSVYDGLKTIDEFVPKSHQSITAEVIARGNDRDGKTFYNIVRDYLNSDPSYSFVKEDLEKSIKDFLDAKGLDLDQIDKMANVLGGTLKSYKAWLRRNNIALGDGYRMSTFKEFVFNVGQGGPATHHHAIVAPMLLVDSPNIGQIAKEWSSFTSIFDQNLLGTVSPINRGVNWNVGSTNRALREELFEYLRPITNVFFDDDIVPLSLHSIPTSSVISASSRQMELSDAGEIYDEISQNFMGFSALMSDPYYATSSIAMMMREISNEQFRQTSESLSEQIIMRSDTNTLVPVYNGYNSTTNRFMYSFDINYQYDGEQATFTLILGEDQRSILKFNGLNYTSYPLLVDGEWNKDLFIDMDSSESFQTQLSAGLIPIPTLTDASDPLNVLKLIFYLDASYTQNLYVNTLDQIFNIFEVQAMTLDDQYIPILINLYKDLEYRDIDDEYGIEFFNKKSGKNETMTSVFESLKTAQLKDKFRSNNPLENIMASNIMSSQIKHNLINEKYFSQDTSSAYYSYNIMDSELGDNLFLDKGINPSFNDFFTIDIQDSTSISNNYINFLDISGMNFIFDKSMTYYTNPYSNVADSEVLLHNLFGSFKVDSVYPSLGLTNNMRFIQAYKHHYKSLKLISPNKGLLESIGNSFSLTLGFDFLHFGVRNNYGELPRISKYLLSILGNPNYYYSDHGEYLLNIAYTGLGV